MTAVAGAVATRLVVGLGNSDRGDDGVGPAVARRVAGRAPPPVRVAVHEDPTALLDLWTATDLVVVVDAVRTGRDPGTVLVLEAGAEALPARAWADAPSGGTHALGLAAVVELARALDLLPARLVVVGVEGASFAHGDPLSPPVAAAVPAAVDAVTAVLERGAGGGG